ncbi:MAG: hypothetical protein P6D49_07005 [Acidimicrobiales bacterium]|nr:hypothetical protein [Acidimicrobiales bacterium]
MRVVGSVEDDRREPESDLTLLCLRLAEGFRPEGYQHPVAAAVAVAARGITGLGQTEFAERFGRSEVDVEAAETGAVAFVELPAEVGDILEASQRFDLLQLADLDRAFRRLPAESDAVVVDWVQGQFAGLAVDARARAIR